MDIRAVCKYAMYIRVIIIIIIIIIIINIIIIKYAAY